MEQIKV